MSRHQLICLGSAEELRAAAPAWDDLWWRSEIAAPTARAEMVAQWLGHFMPQAEFQALVVEHDGRWVAALPLVAQRVGGLLSAGGIPSNAWTPAGELLLDADADLDTALGLLVAAIGGLPWQVLWLDGVAAEARGWTAFRQACGRAGMAVHHQPQFLVGRLEINHDWEAYKQSLSRSHRQTMAKTARRLERSGQVRLELHSRLLPQQVETMLRRGFEVEDRSWKGEAGTSVLSTPGMFSFFLRQAEQLAAWGQLELGWLELDRRAIAFLYGFRAKGVCHAFKIGYDPQYAAFGPGQLLFYHLLERLHGDAGCRALDCMGPLGEFTSRWRPATYTVGRVVVAPRRLIGRLALHVYQRWWPTIRRLRDWGKVGPRLDALRRGSPADRGGRMPRPAGLAS